MARFRAIKNVVDAVPRTRRGGRQALLGEELEMLMRERERLLRAAGAAAALFSALDFRDQPVGVTDRARKLAASLDALPEETLGDALRKLHSEARTQLAA